MKTIITFLLTLFAFAAHAEIKGYACLGTEPFWNLQISGTALKLDLVESAKTYKVTGPQTPQGLQEGYVSVYKAPEKNAVISIVSGNCTDGMSDNTYSYHVVYVEGETALYGCCEPLAQDQD